MTSLTTFAAPDVDLALDIDPVPKDRPRFGSGRTYATARQRGFEEEFRWLCLAAGVREPLTGLLAVAYDFHLPHKRLTDLDNLCKNANDSGNGVLWVDDRQIRMYRWVTVYDGAPKGRIEVKAWRL